MAKCGNEKWILNCTWTSVTGMASGVVPLAADHADGLRAALECSDWYLEEPVPFKLRATALKVD